MKGIALVNYCSIAVNKREYESNVYQRATNTMKTITKKGLSFNYQMHFINKRVVYGMLTISN